MTERAWKSGWSRPTGGDLVTIETAPTQTRTDLTELREDDASLRDRTRLLHHDTTNGHQRVRLADIDQRAAEHGRRSLAEVLGCISDYGFSWREIARAIGVSVPALRKWRRGEPATPSNRTRAGRLLAVCEYLTHNVPVIDDVASWFELPLVADPPITPLDLYADNREDLVLDYGEQQEPDPAAVLDRYDRHWRDRRSGFEVIVADDGRPTIQRRP